MTPDVRVAARARSPLPAAAAARLARRVLEAERRTAGSVSITFVGPAGIRRLNRDYLHHDRLTDVISFGLGGPMLAADIYICPAVAAANAREFGTTPRREVERLVVHGVLHALGYDHPDGPRRTASPMWKRQERYLAKFAGAGAK